MSELVKRLPGRPKDESLQNRRREEILDQAARTFAEQGYQRTDVQWIADAIGVCKGTVYRHFASKEELFLAAVKRGVDRLYQHVTASRAGIDDTLELIRVSVISYLEFFKKNPQLAEMFIQERAEFKSHGRPIYFQHKDARRAPWEDLIREQVEKGRIRAMPVDRVLDVLGDVLYGTMFTNHFAGRDKPFEAQAQDILDVFFKGILSDKEKNRH
jgi:AcrR family transcriptional regulator